MNFMWWKWEFCRDCICRCRRRRRRLVLWTILLPEMSKNLFVDSLIQMEKRNRKKMKELPPLVKKVWEFADFDDYSAKREFRSFVQQFAN